MLMNMTGVTTLSSAQLGHESIEDHPNVVHAGFTAVLTQERIVVDPKVLGGQPHVRGTRIPVAVVVDGLAEGLTPVELIDHYPRLTLEDIRAAVEYVASRALTAEE